MSRTYLVVKRTSPTVVGYVLVTLPLEQKRKRTLILEKYRKFLIEDGTLLSALFCCFSSTLLRASFVDKPEIRVFQNSCEQPITR